MICHGYLVIRNQVSQVRSIYQDKFRRYMDNMKIEVINYLDMHAKVNNKQMEPFGVSKLRKAFPELDEFLLKKIESEWRKERQRMLNLDFDV